MERDRFILGRWREYDGEVRSTLLRLILIVVFYAIQLVHHLSLSAISDPQKIFHRQVTLVAAGWLILSLAVFIALKGGVMPAALKYVTTTLDLGFVLLLCWLGNGPASPLVNSLFVVIAMSALRCRSGLVWYACAMASAGYMGLVAYLDQSWFDPEHATPVIDQAITVCSMFSVGAILDQMIRSLSFSARKS